MGLLIDSGTETVKHEIKNKQGGRFLGPMIEPVSASLIAPIASSLIKTVPSSFLKPITGKGQESRLLLLLALPLLIKFLGNGARRAGVGYNNMDLMDKKL